MACRRVRSTRLLLDVERGFYFNLVTAALVQGRCPRRPQPAGGGAGVARGQTATNFPAAAGTDGRFPCGQQKSLRLPISRIARQRVEQRWRVCSHVGGNGQNGDGPRQRVLLLDLHAQAGQAGAGSPVAWCLAGEIRLPPPYTCPSRNRRRHRPQVASAPVLSHLGVEAAWGDGTSASTAQ